MAQAHHNVIKYRLHCSLFGSRIITTSETICPSRHFWDRRGWKSGLWSVKMWTMSAGVLNNSKGQKSDCQWHFIYVKMSKFAPNRLQHDNKFTLISRRYTDRIEKVINFVNPSWYLLPKNTISYCIAYISCFSMGVGEQFASKSPPKLYLESLDLKPI